MVTANTDTQSRPSTVSAADTSRPRQPWTRALRVSSGRGNSQQEQITSPEVGSLSHANDAVTDANGVAFPSRQASTFPAAESVDTETSSRGHVERGTPAAREGRRRGQGNTRVTGRSRNVAVDRNLRTDAVTVARGDQAIFALQNNSPQTSNGRTSGRNFGRQFGERLTTADRVSTSTSSLHGDAPIFVPGQQHHARSRRAQKTSHAPQPDLRHESNLKSTKPDIASRTHDDISNGVYECPICTIEVLKSSKIWSCKTCWTVFHLACVSTWARDHGSTQSQQRSTEDQPRQWRCPGCNLPKDVLPTSYTCWCEKEADPRSISGLPPHSCGQTCGKQRLLPKKCPHPCELLCHAGPCPPCTHMGPTRSCFCGKKSTARRCVDTNYAAGWSCEETCGDPMPCGEHTCQKSCHEGLCGACDVQVDCHCYCGKDRRSLFCHEREQSKGSQGLEEGEEASSVLKWDGCFECGVKCERMLDCGKHSCGKTCHSQDLGAGHCPRSPDVVVNCPCGKTKLSELLPISRKSCEDSIPNCDKKCLKKLVCGHTCQQICHADACMPCTMKVTIGCRCGRVQSRSVCHQGNEVQPQCLRICKTTLGCGRHECGERCCSGERKAADRQATKRKLRPLGVSRVFDGEFEVEHICIRQCGRALKCGNHTCAELCHKGACGTCREAVFDDISCHCGNTVLQPPLPCGTAAPKCLFNCQRLKHCGHPPIPHNCHTNEESCPKCPFLTTKPCMCGKKDLKNQPCWLSDVRCGETCRHKLRCGSHFCRMLCHRPGECEDAARPCQQSCGKAKKACAHPCEEPCHAPSICHEDKPCQNKMLITCRCQYLKQEIKCGASKRSEGNSKKLLDCDGECARLERNRKLALALNIDPDAHKDDHIPYCNETLKLFRENPKWAQAQEREFRVFAADESEKRLRFKPMTPNQRTFLHSLSNDFGFDSESMDPEPHRHVAVFKTPKFVMAPMKTLAECVRIRNAAEALSTAAAEAERSIISTKISYNGFILAKPRFGLTVDELRNDLSSVLIAVPGVSFDISFLPSEEIALKASPATSASTTLEATLKTLKTFLSAIIASKRLANSIQLCTLDNFLNVCRRELDPSDIADGWSQVAAKGATPRLAPRQTAIGEKSVYTVLGSKLKDTKKKKQEMQKAQEEEVVVDDWEEEVRKEEAAKEAEERNKTSVVEVEEPNKTAVLEVQELNKTLVLTDAEGIGEKGEEEDGEAKKTDHALLHDRRKTDVDSSHSTLNANIGDEQECSFAAKETIHESQNEGGEEIQGGS